MFGYFFPPFPMAIVPMTPEELDELSGVAIRAKQRKQTERKKNKRRWKIIYKGKLGEDARHIIHTKEKPASQKRSR